MAAKKLTSAELLEEVRDHDGRLVKLEEWKRAEDAYRAALAQIKKDELQSKKEHMSDEASKRRTELMKQVSIILGLVIVLLYAFATSQGITP